MDRKKIKAIRKLKGYTQKFIASKMYMTQASYSRRETGTTKFTQEEIQKIEGILSA